MTSLKSAWLRRQDTGARPGHAALSGEAGIALVTALIITTVAFLLIASTLYISMQSTRTSGPVYPTACQAGDGAVAVLQDAITKSIAGTPLPQNVFALPLPGHDDFGTCLFNIQSTPTGSCPTTLILPAPMGKYTVNAKVTTLFGMKIAGGTLRYPPVPTGSSNAIYYRIGTRVSGPDNTTCDNSVVYRYVP